MASQICARLASELGLSASQATQIAPIVADMVDQMSAEHARTVARALEIIRKSHESMEPLLTTAQRARLARIRDERERALHQPPPESPAADK